MRRCLRVRTRTVLHAYAYATCTEVGYETMMFLLVQGIDNNPISNLYLSETVTRLQKIKG